MRPDRFNIISVDLSESIKERALEIGFDLAGVAPAAIGPDLEFSRKWVAAGFGGEMRYLENPKRDDPRRILSSARSVVCVGLIYNAPLPYSTEISTLQNQPAVQGSLDAVNDGPSKPHETRAWISRYAWGRDYHEVMRAKLERLRSEIERLAPGAETRVYVDTGPVIERAFARYSGIGWTGKNTCLINEQKGSWFFLGVILTSLPLLPSVPAPDRCGSCTRCVEACPTGALVKPYVMDASRCIAYLTIEHKGAIPEKFRPAIGMNMFGCDICQDVCPWNAPRKTTQPSPAGEPRATKRRAVITSRPEFQPVEIEPSRVSLFNPPLRALASMTEEDFRRVFSHSPVKRAKYRGWLRNLCVAMGNSGNAVFIPWLERVRDQADALIREHAVWAIERLRKSR
jgi:epoxyqueuosine reductase